MAETASGEELTGRDVSNCRNKAVDERSRAGFAFAAAACFAPAEPCLLCFRMLSFRSLAGLRPTHCSRWSAHDYPLAVVLGW